jgi:ATP-dependent protease ClpP protease subunit
MKRKVMLFGDIGEGWGTDGNWLSREIQGCVDSPQCTEIEIAINSFGGSMLGGFDILSPIRNSTKPVVSTIEGFCCSMASMVAVVCNKGKRKMVDYGLIMIHNPYMPEKPNYDELEESEKAMVESSALIYANATGQTGEKIKEMMKAETWLNASEALELGFIDEIIYTNVAMPQDIVESAKKEGVKVAFDKFILVSKKTANMNKILVALSLVEGNEDAIVAKIKDLQSMAKNLELQVKTLQESENKLNTSLSAYQQREAEEKEALCVALVEKAVAEKRISRELANDWLEDARENYDRAEKQLNAITPVVSMAQMQKQGNKGEGVKDVEFESQYPTLSQWYKQKKITA